VYDDTELLAIADTLISLGAPPTHRPPPLPVPLPVGAHSAPTPAVTGGQLEDSTLAPNALIEPEGAIQLGASCHESEGEFSDADVDVVIKNIDVSVQQSNVRGLTMKVSEVRRDNADLRINVDDDVDDVLTLAEGRGRGQPGEEVMNVFVQHAGHGSPSTPAVDASGALRVARERLSIASNALANVDLSCLFGCVSACSCWRGLHIAGYGLRAAYRRHSAHLR